MLQKCADVCRIRQSRTVKKMVGVLPDACPYSPCHVMPAAKAVRVEYGEGPLSATDAAAEMGKFLASRQNKEELWGLKLAKNIFQKERVASLHKVQALDHILQMYVLGGLSSFRSQPGASKVLLKDEVPYMAETAPWASHGPPSEASVWRTSATARNGVHPRPVAPATASLIRRRENTLHFVCGGLALKAVWLRDPHHRHWRDVSLACKEAGQTFSSSPARPWEVGGLVDHHKGGREDIHAYGYRERSSLPMFVALHG